MKTSLIILCLVSACLMHVMPSQGQGNEMDSTGQYACPPCNSTCDDLSFKKAGTCHHCGMKLVLKSELAEYKRSKRMKIAFYLQPGVEILDFAGPMEVFAYAGYEVFTVSKTKEPIISQGILKILPDYDITDAPKADILAFFGGNSGAASNDSAVINWVKSQEEVAYHFSVCTGAFVLAESGILNGKTATTFHNALDDLEHNYSEIKVLKNARYVDNGKVITTAGISAGIDGALHLVAKLQGFNTARKTAYHMEYDKWTPAEGLLLSEDNPYKGFMKVSEFEEYIGKYEFLNGQTLLLKVNEREQSLYAEIDGRSFPLFYEGKDHFHDVSGDEVVFVRDESGNIKGYTSVKQKNQLFKRVE